MTMTSLTYLLYTVLLSLAISSNVAVAGPPRLTQPIPARQRREASDNIGLGLSVVCLPTTISNIENHEGRHKCAYDHPGGFRAVGAGYNLDDDVETRKSELSILFLDYDKIYTGDSCLWDVQITLLVTLDARRALDKVTKSVKSLENFCCEVQAVFADIQHSSRETKIFSSRDLKGFVDKAALQEWTAAARELEGTDWCYDNKKRCEDHIATVASGCNRFSRVRGI